MDRAMFTLVTAVVGAISGLTGAVLGVTNFVRAVFKDRVKLRVSPAMNLFLEKDPADSAKTIVIPRVCIEVINLSDFPVTVKDVGFITDMYMKNGEISFFDKKIAGGGELPNRMEARTSITIFHPDPNMLKDSFDKLKAAYAITQCGERFVGKSKRRKKNHGFQDFEQR